MMFLCLLKGESPSLDLIRYHRRYSFFCQANQWHVLSKAPDMSLPFHYETYTCRSAVHLPPDHELCWSCSQTINLANTTHMENTNGIS